MSAERIPRFAIVGAGALGCYIAAVLGRSGCPVGLIARGEHLAAIEQRGILVESAEGFLQVRPWRVSADPAAIGPVDFIFLTVKTWQVPAALESIEPLLKPATRVLPLQNGIETTDEIAKAINPSHALLGLCRIVCLLVAPGHVRHVAVTPTIAMGEPSGGEISAGAAAAAVELEHAGIRVEQPQDMYAALWQKLLFIAGTSGVGSVTRSTIGEFRECPESRALLVDVMNEVWGLARACSIKLAEETLSKTLGFIDGMAPVSTTSMQRDVAAGRPSELEAIIGVLTRLSSQHGIPVPAAGYIYASLLPQELRARSQAK